MPRSGESNGAASAAPLVSDEQIERGIALANRGGEQLRWAWADLALEVAPPGESGRSNGQDVALRELRERVAASVDVYTSDLPKLGSLRQYRDAAAAVPPGARDGVPVGAAMELWRAERDPARRLAVLDELRAAREDGRVTVDAVRVYFGRVPTREPRQSRGRRQEPPPESPRRRAPRRNFNGQTNSGRTREMRERRVQAEAASDRMMLDFQAKLGRLCSMLQATRFEDVVDNPLSLRLSVYILDDLVNVVNWANLMIAQVQAHLDAGDVRARIEQLRNVEGREPEEARAFLAAADRLEARLEGRNGLASGAER